MKLSFEKVIIPIHKTIFYYITLLENTPEGQES